MDEKPKVRSEAEELDSFLAELESRSEIREIAGWESGFPRLSRALNGISPGLYLLVGPPGCGKTTFAKQLCDQIAFHNSVAVLFFTFSERKRELRIMTLARLSGLENGEIKKGSAFVLYQYGVPRLKPVDADQTPASWEKLKNVAEAAKPWLDRVYIFEGGKKTDLKEIENQVHRVREVNRSEHLLVVIDDSQRLDSGDRPLDLRLPLLTEQLRGLAADLQVAIVATWPDLRRKESRSAALPQEWAERCAGAQAVLVMELDSERTKKLTEPNRAITLHIVQNRGGEKGKVDFDFFPATSRFAEALRDSTR